MFIAIVTCSLHWCTVLQRLCCFHGGAGRGLMRAAAASVMSTTASVSPGNLKYACGRRMLDCFTSPFPFPTVEVTICTAPEATPPRKGEDDGLHQAPSLVPSCSLSHRCCGMCDDDDASAASDPNRNGPDLAAYCPTSIGLVMGESPPDVMWHDPLQRDDVTANPPLPPFITMLAKHSPTLLSPPCPCTHNNNAAATRQDCALMQAGEAVQAAQRCRDDNRKALVTTSRFQWQGGDDDDIKVTSTTPTTVGRYSND
ncbi:hypothetical protein EDB85DRAFT_1884934 [Lactarius pseudohatsudake]|nr:hypothetical protein EDB85DRAFT_1884934 [Lactarius pseudohatsudake]